MQDIMILLLAVHILLALLVLVLVMRLQLQLPRNYLPMQVVQHSLFILVMVSL
jgi:heme/copper-type cytochrome/quinol oxidase subunit 1